MVRAVLLDQSSIDDVLQEAFARVLQSRKDFSDRGEAFHYLRKTVLSTTIDLYRRSKRYNCRVVECQAPPEFSPYLLQEEPDPLGLLILQEQAEEQRHLVSQVKAALATLPPSQQEAIELFFGRSKKKRLKEICIDSGIPYSTLRSRMMRGVDGIRLRLREEGMPGFLECEEVKTR
jgi:RNA polymerase sigma factor (sigma-70 family)